MELKMTVKEALLKEVRDLPDNIKSGMVLFSDGPGEQGMKLVNVSVQELAFAKEMLARVLFKMMDEIEKQGHRSMVPDVTSLIEIAKKNGDVN